MTEARSSDIPFFEELSESYTVLPGQIEQFHSDGYIKLGDVLSTAVINEYGPAIQQAVEEHNKQSLPLSERGTYGKAFLQVPNLWELNDKVKAFVFSRRLGQIAADLMGVSGVRMYHDQALFKEPSGGFTPWHADQFYWPLSNENTVTAWIPLQQIPLEMGPLSFCVGSQRLLQHRDLAISDESEEKISKSLRDYPIDTSPYNLGDVSFHSGWVFHRAGPNETDRMRGVMTIIYMEDGMRVAEPRNQSQRNDWERWLPGASLGEEIDTPLNPVIYRRS